MQRIYTQLSPNTGVTYSPRQDAQSNYTYLMSLFKKGDVANLEFALNNLSLPQEGLHALLYAVWSENKFDMVKMMCNTTSYAPSVLATLIVDAFAQGQADQRQEDFAFWLLNKEAINAKVIDKALHVAAARGRNLNNAVDVINKLLVLGANVLSLEDDKTAAQVADACQNRDPDICALLLTEQSSQKGCEPSLKDKTRKEKAEKEAHQKKMALFSVNPTEQVSLSNVLPEIKIAIGQLLALQDLLSYGSTSKEFNAAMQEALKNYTQCIPVMDKLKGTTIAILEKVSCLSLRFMRVREANRLEYWENIVQLTNLQTLDLRDSRVTDAIMSEVGKLTNLRTLTLASGVTDAGMHEVGKLTQLQTLDLQRTKVTDAGMHEVGKLIKLHKLYLNRTNVTDAGKDALRKALPELGFIY